MAGNSGKGANAQTVHDILRGSAHALTVFKSGATDALEICLKRGKPHLKCFATGQERPAKPEEIIRQLYIRMLMQDYGYPAERWTLTDLAEHNVLVKEQATLKKIILDMENLVLANAGVDAFEEVFKLISAKLYDEANAAQGGKQARYLQFRVGGATPREFKDKISQLFDAANDSVAPRAGEWIETSSLGSPRNRRKRRPPRWGVDGIVIVIGLPVWVVNKFGSSPRRRRRINK